MKTIGKKPARSASRLVRQLFGIIDASGLSYYEIWARTGVHAVTLSYWKHGKNQPRWVDFENVAQALGHRIEIVPDNLSDVSGDNDRQGA